jgi:hypothetical protein
MSLTTTLIIAAVAVLIVLRVITKQTQGSPVTIRSLLGFPVVLLVTGVASASDLLAMASGRDLLLLVVDALILLVLGAARGSTVTVSEKDGVAFQKGTKWTLVLWLATVAARVGVLIADHALGMDSALTNASFAVTLGVTLAAQNAVIFERTRRLGLTMAISRARR